MGVFGKFFKGEGVVVLSLLFFFVLGFLVGLFVGVAGLR